MLEGGPGWSGKSAGRLHSAGRYAGAKACILTVLIVDGAGPRSLSCFPAQARAGASASGADATSLFGNLQPSSSVDRCEPAARPYPLQGPTVPGGFRGAHSLPARALRPCTALSPTLLHFFPATNLGIRHRRPHPRSRDEHGTPRLPSPEPHPFNRQAGRACHLLDRLHPRPRSGVLLGICFGSHVQYGISKSLWFSARVHVRSC